jgi:hypothetical protein
LQERKHFFSKNISDYSIGAYKGLCEGIDSTFKAVPVAAPAGAGSVELVRETLILTEVYKHFEFLFLANI